MSFQAAINMVKGGAESLVNKVEEAALSAMSSTILGVDEKTQEEMIQEMSMPYKEEIKETKVETGKASPKKETKVETAKASPKEETKVETAKASPKENFSREKELELQNLRGQLHNLENEIGDWKRKYADQVNLKRQLESESQEERRLLQERLSILSHSFSTLQESSKEKESTGREQYLELQRKTGVEISLLQSECSKWVQIVSKKETKIAQLKKDLENKHLKIQELEAQLKVFKDQEMLLPNIQLEKLEEKQFSPENVPKKQLQTEIQPESKEEHEELLQVHQSMLEELKLKFQEQLLLEEQQPLLEEQQPLIEEKQPLLLEDQKPAFEEQQPKLEEQLEGQEDAQEEVQEEVQEEAKSYNEPLLTQEEIAERLKQHHGAVPAPATLAGGKRIKQNHKGLHIVHKPTLVEKRDEKIAQESIGTSVESASHEIARQEKEIELSQKEEHLRRISVEKSKHEPSKAVPSTYFPPGRARHESERKNAKAVSTIFQPV